MTTEHLVREALRAKAAQVRPEEVNLPFPDLARARRPLRTGMAVLVAASVAAVLVATWAVTASRRAADLQPAAGGASGPVSTATSAAGPAVLPPFRAPVGWQAVTKSLGEAYTSWCVTDRAAGSTCPGVTVYLAAAGQAVPVDDAVVPACGAASISQHLVTSAVIDDRPASWTKLQCTPADPVWAVWRTDDGAFAVVAQESDIPAYTAAAEIIAGVHLPGSPPARAVATRTSAQPVPSTVTGGATPSAPPVASGAPSAGSGSPTAAGSTSPSSAAGSEATDAGRPTG